MQIKIGVKSKHEGSVRVDTEGVTYVYLAKTFIGFTYLQFLIDGRNKRRRELLRAGAARPGRGCSPAPSDRSPEPAPEATPLLRWLK